MELNLQVCWLAEEEIWQFIQALSFSPSSLTEMQKYTAKMLLLKGISNSIDK